MTSFNSAFGHSQELYFLANAENLCYTLNGAPFGKFLMSWRRKQALSENGGFWAVKLTLDSVRPESIPHKDEGVCEDGYEADTKRR